MQLCRDVAEAPASAYMEEGTAAHALGELCLRKDVSPETYVGTTLEGVEVTEEMAEAVAVYTHYCGADDKWVEGTVWIEHRFNLADLKPPAPMYGTADFVAYDPATRELEVVDLKFGRGVVVEVAGNPQLRYYALGAALSLKGRYPIEYVKSTVVQPRAGHPDGPVRSEVIPILELLDWSADLFAAARATLAPNAPLVAGRQCRFCPASGSVRPRRRRHWR